MNELASLLAHKAWLMDERTAILLYNHFINGKLDPASFKQHTEKRIAALYPGMNTINIGEHAPVKKFQHKSGKNVALMPIYGTLTKRGEFCSYGMRDYQSEIIAINKNDDIAAIVLDMEGPGGTIDGLKEFGMAIAQSKKPIVAFGDNMVASADYYIASQCAMIFGNANNPTEFGSIGTLCVHEYWGKYIEENIGSIKIIRAPQSVDKARVNAVEPLTAELEAEIVADLKSCTEDFFAAVKSGRGNRLKATEQEWGTGKMFKVSESLTMGLIDAQGSLMDAIDKAVELSGKTSPQPSSPGEGIEASTNANHKKMNMKKVARQVSSFFKKKAAKAAEGEPAAAEDSTPMWTEEMTFNTDGSGDGAFCLHPDSSGTDRKFETKIDNNKGMEPPTDPAVTEDDNWAVVVEEAAAEEEYPAEGAEATTVVKLNAALKKATANEKKLAAEVTQLKTQVASMQKQLDAKPAGNKTTVVSSSDKGPEYAGKKAVHSWEKKAARKVGIETE